MDEMLTAFSLWAVFCDAWCEASAFTAAEVRAVLGRAKELGYAIRVPAAQLAPGEGPDIAAELGASSADHLEFATAAQISALAKAGTVAVLCPGANFTTHGPRPKIEAMRTAGLAMAIASDLNPGTSNSESLPMAMSLACVQWGMTPLEVLSGATVQAARSVGLNGLAGCLRPGRLAAVGAARALPVLPFAGSSDERLCRSGAGLGGARVEGRSCPRLLLRRGRPPNRASGARKGSARRLRRPGRPHHRPRPRAGRGFARGQP